MHWNAGDYENEPQTTEHPKYQRVANTGERRIKGMNQTEGQPISPQIFQSVKKGIHRYINQHTIIFMNVCLVTLSSGK